MTRDFPTARYLDEPTRFSGLTVVQWLAATNSLGQGYGAWLLIGFGGALSLPVGGAWGLGLRVFLCALWAAATFLVVVLLAGGGRREQFGRQYLGYLLRRHTYGPPPSPSPKRGRRKMKGWFTGLHHRGAPPEKKGLRTTAPHENGLHHGAHHVAPEKTPPVRTTHHTTPSSCGGGARAKKARRGARR